ncbi:hypothetical protein HPP92_023063 [Vanilla planifolia]|uniref:Uncharacterized protein n=1 Tax=Vanilla planifolia TaxID=51239 RepID=A0A835PTE8_VANPL|nr:hypothetical protein HPP92_023063 [Vanilla planifolia]
MQGVTKRTRKRCDGGKCNGTDVKVPKIISRIFHRKIHPETTVASKKLKNYSHHHLDKEKSHTSSNYNNCSTKSKCAAYGTQGKLGISSFKCHSSPPSSAELGMKMAHGRLASTGSRPMPTIWFWSFERTNR